MSTRAPPVRVGDGPPAYAMVSRVYRSSLRPVVAVSECRRLPAPARVNASLSCSERNLRSVVADMDGACNPHFAARRAINAFRVLNYDKSHGEPKLATFAIVLGVIYAFGCGVEVWGVGAAATQNMMMIRLYAVLSVVSSLAVIGAGLMRVIIHFILKNDLINECTSLLKDGTVEFVFGFWGPVVEKNVSPQDVDNICKNAWSHDSFTEIIELIIELLLSLFFIAISYAYYQQMLDPTSAANTLRQPLHARASADEAAFPAHYNPPYLAYDPAARAPPYDAAYAPRYAPPPGPPPGLDAREPDTKPPGYGVGAGAGTGGDFKDAEGADDPFADFEGMSGPQTGAERRT
ncbi:hypothetical protein OBBRIDRAFT_834980 [Obba rivulosa]|uniref:Uncharacterized protein n=1 Tax=Obba rivulosa TaxID=1052685 RepID=A0A8E2AYB2_9APHY|nr:hypothetical protein OBBRIDRAFT_834980 [Obba rivulosa]